MKQRIFDIAAKCFNSALSLCRTHLSPLINNIIKIYSRVVAALRGSILKRCACLMATLCIVLSVVLVCTTKTSALQVSVNGNYIGTVSNQSVLDDALKTLEEQTVVTDIDSTVSFTVTEVQGSDDVILTPENACQAIIEAEGTYVYACGVFVDGAIVAYADTLEKAETMLTDWLAKFSAENANAEFIETVDKKFGLYLESTLGKLPTLDKLLVMNESSECKTVKVKNGDTAASLAEQYNLTEDQLLSINPDCEFKVGDKVKVVSDLSLISVLTTFDRTETSKSGRRTTVKSCTVTAINGVEVNKLTITSKSYLTLPRVQVKSVGSKGFCWPVDPNSYHYISSYMGDDRDHKGWDIAGTSGICILSVQSGTVVGVNSAGSGYGLNVTISHGNGVRTLYAHCSDIYVSVGQKVSRGQIIAALGNTGRSTGPHLHFEVIKNGVSLNPANYLR